MWTTVLQCHHLLYQHPCQLGCILRIKVCLVFPSESCTGCILFRRFVLPFFEQKRARNASDWWRSARCHGKAKDDRLLGTKQLKRLPFHPTISNLDTILLRGLLMSLGGWGEGKMKARGVQWEGEREAAFSLFPSSPARFLFFDHCFFHWDTQREPLRRK